MKIDPYTLELFDRHGHFLKQLSCPKSLLATDFTPCSARSSICRHCEKEVHDTAEMTEEEVIRLLKEEPTSCLSIGMNQENCLVKPISTLIKRK